MTAVPTQPRELSERAAEEIRAWMGRRRVTGATLARALGVSTAWVSYRLSGKQEIGLNDLEAIARVLNVDVIDLLVPGGRSRHTHEYDRTRLSGRPRAARVLNPSVRRPKPLTLPDEPVWAMSEQPIHSDAA